jgi:hypothetical protein
MRQPATKPFFRSTPGLSLPRWDTKAKNQVINTTKAAGCDSEEVGDFYTFHIRLPVEKEGT